MKPAFLQLGFFGLIQQYGYTPDAVMNTVLETIMWKTQHQFNRRVVQSWLDGADGVMFAERLIRYFDECYPSEAAAKAVIADLRQVKLDQHWVAEYGLAANVSYLDGVLQILSRELD